MSKSVIEEVLETVIARGAIYGPPHEDYKRTAKMWSAYLGYEITAHQATAMMMLVKISRLAKSPDHKDSLLDVAGYVWCYEDCIKNGE